MTKVFTENEINQRKITVSRKEFYEIIVIAVIFTVITIMMMIYGHFCL